MQAENTVSYNDLPMIDRHALFQLETVVKNITESYDKYQFFKIFQVCNILLEPRRLFLIKLINYLSQVNLRELAKKEIWSR